MAHNIFAHLVLGAILFGVSMFVFDGAGVYTVILSTTAETAGNLMVADEDFAGTADRLEAVMYRIVATVASIVFYYLLAAIVIGVFSLFGKKK